MNTNEFLMERIYNELSIIYPDEKIHNKEAYVLALCNVFHNMHWDGEDYDSDAVTKTYYDDVFKKVFLNCYPDIHSKGLTRDILGDDFYEILLKISTVEYYIGFCKGYGDKHNQDNLSIYIEIYPTDRGYVCDTCHVYGNMVEIDDGFKRVEGIIKNLVSPDEIVLLYHDVFGTEEVSSLECEFKSIIPSDIKQRILTEAVTAIKETFCLSNVIEETIC